MTTLLQRFVRLREYRVEPTRLAHLLYWESLVAPGVLRQKDGSLLGAIAFRGPDMESAGQAELVSLSARLNHLLKSLGSSWGLFVEARRSAAQPYPLSPWPDPVSGLVDEERRIACDTHGAHFETAYTLTLVRQ